MNSIGIIIPTYNRREDLEECLDSLRTQTYTNFEIIVVSSQSRDGTNEMIEKKYDIVTLIESSKNIFWTESMNIGVETALKRFKLSYLLSFNDDVIVETDYLEKLNELIKKYPHTLICSSCRNYYNKDEHFYSGIKINWENYEFIHNVKPLTEKINFNNDVLTGRGTIIPIQSFEILGNYDYINFPQYLGDYDLSIKAKNKGFPLGFAKDAIVYAKREKTVDIGRGAESLPFEKAWRILTEKTPLNPLYHTRFIEKYCPKNVKTIAYRNMIQNILKNTLEKVRLEDRNE